MENLNHKSKQLYYNRAQKLVLGWRARETFVRGGRGLGKTSMLASVEYGVSKSIPRGTSLFLGNSYKQLYTKTFPGVCKSLDQMGLIEGIHYFRGRPPVKLDWPKPLTVPRTYDNTCCWFNGHLNALISMDVVGSANSYNSVAILGDETRFMPWPKIKEEVLPTLRGELYSNPGWDEKRNPWYLSQWFFSDAAVTQKQAMWEQEEKTQTAEVNHEIAQCLADLEKNPWLAKYTPFLEKLDRLRCKSRVFFNFSSLYNAEILPHDYFSKMEAQMPNLLFRLQIMGQKKGQASDGYYQNFNPEIHLYRPSAKDELNRIFDATMSKHTVINRHGERVDFESPDLASAAIRGLTCEFDVDLDVQRDLYISFDLNAAINIAVIYQKIPRGERLELRVQNCLFVKNGQGIRSLMNKIIAYYAPKRKTNKHVIVATDSTIRQGAAYALGKDEKDASRYENIIRAMLERAGWEVDFHDLKRPMLHEQKFVYVNEVLAGCTHVDVRIREDLDFVIASIENCGVVQTSKGPMKDKSKEKLSSEEGVGGVLEERSDTTDALDVAIIETGRYDAEKTPSGTSGVFFAMPTIR